MFAAFCASPVLWLPKSPIAAKLNVRPAGAAVRIDPLLDELPLVAVYGYVEPGASPETVTAWCRTCPAGSVSVLPPMARTPLVGMFVHHDTIAEVPVTTDR